MGKSREGRKNMFTSMPDTKSIVKKRTKIEVKVSQETVQMECKF